MSDQQPPPPGQGPDDRPAGAPPPWQPPAPGPPAGGPPSGGGVGSGPPGGFAPPGYSGPGGPADGRYSVGAAFSYGWNRFTENVAPIVLGMLIYAAAVVVFYVVWVALLGTIGVLGRDTMAGAIGIGLSAALFGLVAVVANFVIQTGITRAALAITYGRKPELATVLATDSLGQIAIGAVVIAVVSSIGFFLCYIPGLIVVFLTQFFVHFALDKRLDWLDAIKASVSFVNANLAMVLGFFLLSLVAYMVGALACGVGLIVALPVVIIAQAYTYRRLQGEPVAA